MDDAELAALRWETIQRLTKQHNEWKAEAERWKSEAERHQRDKGYWREMYRAADAEADSLRQEVARLHSERETSPPMLDRVESIIASDLPVLRGWMVQHAGPSARVALEELCQMVRILQP